MKHEHPQDFFQGRAYIFPPLPYTLPLFPSLTPLLPFGALSLDPARRSGGPLWAPPAGPAAKRNGELTLNNASIGNVSAFFCNIKTLFNISRGWQVPLLNACRRPCYEGQSIVAYPSLLNIFGFCNIKKLVHCCSFSVVPLRFWCNFLWPFKSGNYIHTLLPPSDLLPSTSDSTSWFWRFINLLTYLLTYN